MPRRLRGPGIRCERNNRRYMMAWLQEAGLVSVISASPKQKKKNQRKQQSHHDCKKRTAYTPGPVAGLARGDAQLGLGGVTSQ